MALSHPPLTENSTQDEDSPKVSSRSYLADNAWILDDFNPAVPLADRTIKWDFEVGQGERFTDQHYDDLRTTSKALLHRLLLGTSEYRPYKRGSVVARFVYLKMLLRWMIAHSVYRFRDLTRSQLVEYRQYVQRRNSTRTRKRDSTKLNGVTSGEKTAFAPLRDLVRFASYIPDYPLFSLAEASELFLDEIPVMRGDGIPAIPPEIVGPLLEHAFQWIRDYAPILIKLRSGLDRLRRKYNADGVASKLAQARVRGAFDILGDGQYIQSARGDIHLGDIDLVEFNMLLGHLETACYIIIAGLTGMRISEMAGLSLSSLSEKRLPDGRTLQLLQSRLIKTSVDNTGDLLHWVAGWVGPDNPVAAAVNVLSTLQPEGIEARSSLFQHWKRRTHFDGRLAVLDEDDFGSLHSGAVTARLSKFSDFIGIRQGWRFSSHQFRKTFARFVATRDWTGLHALKRHFKHVSIQMTNGYAGNDHELRDLIGEYRTDHAHSLLEKVLGADTLAGVLGKRIAATNLRFRGDAGAQVRKECIQAIMDNSDLLILPNEFGLCIFRRETASCGGNTAQIGHSTCIDCKNFVVTADHRPYWQELASDIRELRDDPLFRGASDEQLEAMDLEERRAQNVLESLE